MSNQTKLRRSSWVRQVSWQLAGVLAASVVLGFAFNASSPLGVRFTGTETASLTSTTMPAGQTLQLPAAPSVAMVTNRMRVQPQSPPLPVERPAVKLANVSAPVPASVPSPAPGPIHQHSLHAMRPPPTTTSGTNSPAVEPNPTVIHWAQAKPLVAAGQAVLVDVRHKAMYDAGHIPGAVSLPETSPPEAFTDLLEQHPTNLTLIVYCSSTSCSQSARVATRLVTQFKRPSVKYMTGGYMEYQQAELANQPTPPTP